MILPRFYRWLEPWIGKELTHVNPTSKWQVWFQNRVFMWFQSLCSQLLLLLIIIKQVLRGRTLELCFLLRVYPFPKSDVSMISLSDYIGRRCSRLCQGTEKQISNQKVFCEASPNGLPASADGLRGGQHGNVSSGQSKPASQLTYLWAPLSWIPSFTPKCKQSLLFLSLDLLYLKREKQADVQLPFSMSVVPWQWPFPKGKLYLTGSKPPRSGS